MEKPLSAVLIGQDNLLVECAKVWVEAGHRLAAVATDAPKIRSWAERSGTAVIGCRPEHFDGLEEFDLLFSITHLDLIPSAILDRPRRGAINFHDGPLPDYAGLNTPVWGLLAGESHWGVRWHWMTQRIDAGRVVASRDFDVAPDETALSLNTKNFAAGLDSFRELVESLGVGPVAGTPQTGERKVFLRRHRPPHAGVLDWNQPATRIARQVRALDFGPYPNPVATAKLLLPGSVVNVTRAEARGRPEGAVPGQILDLDGSSLVVACHEGAVRLDGLTSLRGEALDTPSLRRWLDLDVSGVLESPSGPGDWSDALGVHEPFWSERLRTHTPLSWNIQNEADPLASQDLIPTRIDLSVQVPQGLSQASRAAAWGAFVARSEGRRTVDLGIHVTSEVPAWAESLVARWVPARLELGEGVDLSELTRRWTEEQERVEAAGGHLHDLWARLGLPSGLRALQAGVSTGPTDDDNAPEVVFDVREEVLRCSPDFGEAHSVRDRFETFLRRVAQSPDSPIDQVSLLDDGQTRILDAWERGPSKRSQPTCVAQLFDQAASCPDRTAVVSDGARLTYGQLVDEVRALAHQLTERGIGPGRRVGVRVDRGLELVVAPWAVLATGAAYVPLDPDYPEPRLTFMTEDAGLDGILISPGGPLSATECPHIEVRLGCDRASPAFKPAWPASEDLAYVIYTSGSTGRPKGVEVEHGNISHFFAGMDGVVPRGEPGDETWLAVTSLSFDISVLELLWTLCRGFTVVVKPSETVKHGIAPVDFGMFMWGNDEAPGPEKYRLLLEGAEYLDQHGFASVWTPERHFHAFGGPYPNPSVTSAALAVRTRNLAIRAGSCVSPLHHPIRIAEEWAVVDNLSNGRVGISFASGWLPDDFVLMPEAFEDHKERMFRQIEQVRSLWRGEALAWPNPMGHSVELRSLPRPVQSELPVWVTAAGNPETFRRAGEVGAHLLTHLLGQSIEELTEKISVFRKARKAAGYDPGTVTLMLHTHLGSDREQVERTVREPLKAYLQSSMNLLKKYAWTFPAFKSPSSPTDVDLDALSPDELEAMMDHAFERYFATSGLFGTVDDGLEMVNRVAGAGVNEIACLLDFGVPTDAVLQSLRHLVELRRVTRRTAPTTGVRDLIREHRVTHMQCTPSLARLEVERVPDTFRGLDHLLLGGEPLPPALAERLSTQVEGSLWNVYGPTEATVWCAAQKVWDRDGSGLEPGWTGQPAIPIGRPLAGVRLRVADPLGQPCAPGREGELWVAGPTVARGYRQRPQITADRFRETAEGRWYRTGDRARWDGSGRLVHLGRLDHQVKVRGHRIELQEVEAALVRCKGIREAVAVVEGDGLSTFVRVDAGFREPDLRRELANMLPKTMLPTRIVTVEHFPMTPNGKIDRASLLRVPTAAVPKTPATLAPSRPLQHPSAPDEVAQVIRGIWSEVLGRDDVGGSDNFFDLGGHSLLVVQVHQLLKAQLTASVSLTDIYRFPTVDGLAGHLGRSRPNGAPKATSDALSAAASRAEKRKRLLRQRRG